MLVPMVQTDLISTLKGLDHSDSGSWHLLGPPDHLTVYNLERSHVAPHAKDLTEELTPFMEEYFWRVDNGSQEDLFKAMFTPTGMYYHNSFKTILAGVADFKRFGEENDLRNKLWMKHQIDRMSILPTYEGEGPVLVHVFGSHWNGPTKTKDREVQKEDFQAASSNKPFSETFEVVKYQGQWKINRVILMMHDDIINEGQLAHTTE